MHPADTSPDQRATHGHSSSKPVGDDASDPTPPTDGNSER